MDQTNRAAVFGTGGERIQRFLRIPARTLLARNAEGKLFPVPAGDPRAIGFTPQELLLCLEDGVSEENAMDWRVS